MIIAMLLIILLDVFALAYFAHFLYKLEDRVDDLEEEVTRMKLEYRGTFKHLEVDVKHYAEEEAKDDCEEDCGTCLFENWCVNEHHEAYKNSL